MPPQNDRATAIANMHKKIGEVQPCGFPVTWAGRQSVRQIDILITILCTPSYK